MRNHRVYLDYNSTAPLAQSVQKYLSSEAMVFGNPSSTHQTGRSSKIEVDHAIKTLDKIFTYKEYYKLYFHSGATEGISTFFNLEPLDVMIYFESDHPAVHAMAKLNQKKGVNIIKLPLMRNGHFDELKVLDILSKYKNKKCYLNYTYVHNETGFIWNLKKAQKIKEATGCYIHVDCAQIVGKIEHWNELNTHLDFYTFSSHKFGGQKGIGFSFVHNLFPFCSLIPGGGQQSALRGGTINTQGIITTKLALEQIKVNCKENIQATTSLRDKMDHLFESIVKDQGHIVLKDGPRAANTTLWCFKKHKGDFLQIKFDMHNVDVSYGSACSAGSLKGSDTMRAIAQEEYAYNIIRLSLGPESYRDEALILDSLSNILESLT